MPMKVKSDQIRTECYDYMMAAGENIFLPIKARPGEVIVVHSISIYNPSQVNYTHVYKLMMTKGDVRRLTYAASVNAGLVINWNIDVYLINGEECGIALTPDGAGDMVEVTFQILRFRDDEYFKVT